MPKSKKFRRGSKRSFKGARRTKKNRAFKKRGGFFKKVERVVHKMSELKWNQDYAIISNPANINNVIGQVAVTKIPVAQDPTRTGRIGNEFFIKKFSMKISVQANAMLSTATDVIPYRIVIVKPLMLNTYTNMDTDMQANYLTPLGTPGLAKWPPLNNCTLVYDSGLRFLNRDNIETKLKTYKEFNKKYKFRDSGQTSDIGLKEPVLYFMTYSPNYAIVCNLNFYQSWYDL